MKKILAVSVLVSLISGCQLTRQTEDELIQQQDNTSTEIVSESDLKAKEHEVLLNKGLDLSQRLVNQDVSVQVYENSIGIDMNGVLNYKTSEYKLSPQAKPVLREIADFMKANSDSYIKISGYTDSIGNPISNISLSKERAAEVREYLYQNGVNPSKMVVFAYGDASPKCDIGTSESYLVDSCNRRVEIDIYNRHPMELIMQAKPTVKEASERESQEKTPEVEE